MEATTAAGRYNALSSERDPFLNRARDSAKLTIPSLMPPDSHSGHDKLPTPYQGLGARGVNNLSSKLVLALMPPNAPFFKLSVDDYALEELTQDKNARAEVEKALSTIERAVKDEIEAQAMRVTVAEIIKQLLVAGNCLAYLEPNGRLKMFRLDSYVVRRDSVGNVLEIVTEEKIAIDALPAKTRDAVKEKHLSESNPDENVMDKEVSLYTHVIREDSKWKVYQEVKGEKVEGTEGSYPLDNSPWMALRLTSIDGESYGRGYVEEYYGDLRSLEALTQAIVEGSSAAAKVLFLVNPNGVTKAKNLAQAKNGAIISGNAEDVSVLQTQKHADFRIAYQTIEEITSRLSFAFLLNTAVQRGGERVTAEEIRYMASELEDALGGVYSILSQEFQYPLVNRLLHNLQKRKKIPPLPKEEIKPTLTTGVEALGRGHDLQRLDTFLTGVLQTLGPEVISQYLNVDDYLTRRGNALGIDMDGLVKSEEQVQQEREAAMRQAQQQAFGAKAVEGGIDVVKEAVKGGMSNGSS